MANEVQYSIGWSDPNQHLYDISVTFRAKSRNSDLRLPAWRPGRYLIQNYAANVRQWWAKGEGGRPLPVRKSDNHTWSIESKSGEQVTFGYRFFAGLLDAGSSFLDESEAYFNGTNLFVMVADQRRAPVTLRMQVPKGWNVATQLRQKSGSVWTARDYDYLIDSTTIISPKVAEYRFKESGCDVSLVFQNGEGVDTRQFVAPTKRIVRGHAELFGGIPTDRYAFLYHVGSTWHGVEHEDSCSIILKRSELLGATKGDEAYDHTLSITSHEFFHLWNVKRILPQLFNPYDYSRETPTHLLWVMEGITSYYGEKMLRRSGLWSRERYLKHLGTEISALESIPGRKYLALSQASFDGWLQDPAQMHDKSNAWISFYVKGEIVAALLDIEIRRETKGKRSLDDLMRDLWKRYGSRGKGLEEDAIEAALLRISGPAALEFHNRFVTTTEDLPYEEVLRQAGIEMTRKAKEDAATLGVKFRDAGGRLFVDSVRADGSGMSAGLLAGDELLAINGTRVTNEASVRKIISAAGKKELTLVYSRNDVVKTKRVASTTDGAVSIELKLSETRTKEQEAMMRAWLGDDE